MTEKKFKELLEKFFQGTLTTEEEKLLDNFDKEIFKRNKNLSSFTDDQQKKQIKENIWDKINVSQTKRFNKKSIANIAAASLTLILVSTLYFYLSSQTGNNSLALPENEISLELEGGAVKIINENINQTIRDSHGNVVGRQSGDELVYKKGYNSRELIYNTLNVPRGKTFKLELTDGTKVHLNAGSSIKFPVDFQNSDSRQVYLTGEAYLHVAKDSLHPFIVSSEGLNVQVLGTQFNFSSYPEDDFSEVVLVEGSVSLYTDSSAFNDGTNTLLSPGNKGSLDRANRTISTKKVSTSTYTSWLEGKLVFRNMAFENILKKLERHYNVEIINKNKELAKKLFNANFGKQSLFDVLEELKENYGINYTIVKNTVQIN